MSVLGYVRPDSLFVLAAVILVNAAANGTYAGAVVGATKDTLDCVLCLDTLVLKSDDFSAVRRTAGGAIESLRDFAVSEGIDIRIGLIAYANHRVPDWLDAKELTGNAESILDHIAEIEPRASKECKGSDLYAAVAIACGEAVEDQRIDMGWRKEAAKLILIISAGMFVESPDWEGRTVDEASRTTEKLGRAPVYPLLLSAEGAAVSSGGEIQMRRLAWKTGGRVVRTDKVYLIPQVIDGIAKTVVRIHRNEVWRESNRPRALYAALAIHWVIILGTVTVLIIHAARSHPGSDRLSTVPPVK